MKKTKKKQHKYTVYYRYDGFGEVIIPANSPAEAQELFMKGNYDSFNMIDDSRNYEVETVKIKK